MGPSRSMALLVLTLGIAVQASRVRDGSKAASKGSACDLKETDHALGYGIHGVFPVTGCNSCLWNVFLGETFPQKVLSEPEVADEGKSCKCKYSPRWWEGVDQKAWYQFRVNRDRACTISDCQKVFFTWGNQFLKKQHYPGDNEVMPSNKRLESQENYAMDCAPKIPEGLVLPSPGSKITELRLLISKTTDPDEKARLQALLDEMLGNKEVEIFEYDLEGDWGEEHHADTSRDGELHSYYLKPCKSQTGREVTDLHEIIEECGPGVLGTSMQAGKLRLSYQISKDDEWGPEQVCLATAEHCKMLEDEAAKDGWKLLSFRLKPCMTPSKQEVTGLDDVLDGCGKPILGVSMLPVKVSAAEKFDADAPEDDLEFPCA